MEPILSKLQEGVKYPRFERDATKTINDLVEHITKERGIYSSSIEPNPNEHNVWFNTNDNTLYIYNKGVWKTVSDKDTDILNEPIVFYCSKGTLYYKANNASNGGNGIDISGFYNKERLKYVIENFEGKTIDNMVLTHIYIEPEDKATIIIGENKFITNIAILGIDLNDANIHIYNNVLYIGNLGDSSVNNDNIYWYNATVYCNSKHIGNIKVTHSDSDLDLYISAINFIIGNDNTLTIDKSVADAIEECNIYVIKETDNDKSKISFPNAVSGYIAEYVNLCGTAINGTGSDSIMIKNLITTTIDDIDKANIGDSCVAFSDCNILIVDASYRTFNHLEFIDYLKTLNNLSVYVTDEQLFNFLKGREMKCEMAVTNNRYFDDKVIVNYKTTDGTDIYNKTIYK